MFKEHNDKVKALLGKGFKPNTLKGYKTSEKHLKAYLQTGYSLRDIPVMRLDNAFITGFEFYLRTAANCSAVSAAKYIKHLRKIVNECLANGWLKQNPFARYKSRAKAKEREYLNQEELARMVQKVLAIERLTLVRDIFIFCCYTGLSYADVKKLKRTEIVTGIDERQWIFTSREKTETPSRIPLLPAAISIIKKYQDHPGCNNQGLVLPVLSNQKMNAYLLKEIADLSGIHKTLTFHLARHTFATTITLSNGVPIESVSKMLGHTSIKTTQHYAKVLDSKVSEDMKPLIAKFGH